MQVELKPELIAVFDQLGVSEEERANLKDHYLSRLAQSQGDRDQIAANIESLQVQLGEADASIAELNSAIGKVALIAPSDSEPDT